MIDSSTEIVSSFKDLEGNEIVLTGRNALLTNFSVDTPVANFEDVWTMGDRKIRNFLASEQITITMEFKLNQFDENGKPNYLIESLMNGFKPPRKISKLRVEDCTIDELLFAARQKIK